MATLTDIVNKKWVRNLKDILAFRESGILLALVVIGVVVSSISPSFRTPTNLLTIARQMSVVAIVAMGQTLVIISGGFDLSQGSVAGLAAIASSIAAARWGWPVPVCILIMGVGIGVACGFFNGLLITRLRLHPVMVTLATSSIFTGINYVWTGGEPVAGVPKSFLWIGRGYLGLGPIRIPILILATGIIALVIHYILTRLIFGRHIFGIGGNAEVARLSGVNVERVQLGVFTLSGLLAGLGGVIMVSRFGSGSPVIGSGLQMPAIAAAVIGGTLLSGGVGSMAGTIIGAAIMGVLGNALVVLPIGVFYQDVVLGFAVLVAVLINQFRRGNLTFRSIFPGRR